MAKGITLKTKNGATGYPKSVTDLIFDNATGKTLKTLIEELKAIDAATDTRTQYYKASVTDLDALNAAANIGTYNYVGNGWRGLVQVCLDHSSNVAQVALSSSSPSYDGNVLSWLASQPCSMARVYRNGAWSHWEKVGAPVVNDLTTGGTDKALSAEMGKTLKEGLDALGPKISEVDLLNNIKVQYTTDDGYVTTSGTINTPTVNQEKYTSEIPVTIGTKLRFAIKYSATCAMWVSYCLYDATHTSLGRQNPINTQGDSASFDVTITNANAAYIRFSWRSFNNGTEGLFIGDLNDFQNDTLKFKDSIPLPKINSLTANVFCVKDVFIDNSYYANDDGHIINRVDTYACTQKIPVDKAFYFTEGFVQDTCLCWSDSEFLGTVLYNNSDERRFDLLVGTKYIAFNFRKSSQGEDYDEKGVIFNMQPFFPIQRIGNRIKALEDFTSPLSLETLKELTGCIIRVSDYFIDNHYYNNNTGAYVSSTVETYACTQKIPVTKGYYCIDGFVQDSCFCYSSSDVFLGLVQYNNATEKKFVLPEGTAFIAFNFRKASQPETYQSKGIIFNLQPFVQEGNGGGSSSSTNILEGKKWCVCGDSFSAWTTEHDGSTYKTYHYFIAQRNNMTIVNMAVSGRTMTYPNDLTFDNAFAKPSVYQSIPADVDYITLMLGINDVSHMLGESQDAESVDGDITLGTIDSSDTGTFYGAWNVVLQWIFENRPLAHVGIIITNGLGQNGPTGTYTDTALQVYEAMKAIVQKWNVPFIDLNGGDGKTPMMQRGIYPQGTPAALIAAKWNAFAASPTSPYNGHTNVAGQLYESTFIENFLRSL